MPDTFYIDYDFPNRRHKNKFMQRHFSFNRHNAPDYVRLWATKSGKPLTTDEGNFYSEYALVDPKEFRKPVELGLVCMVLDPRKKAIDGTVRWTSGYFPCWEEYLSFVQDCTSLAESNLDKYYASKVAKSLPLILTRRIEEALGRVIMMANSSKYTTAKNAEQALSSGMVEACILREKANLEKAIEISQEEFQSAWVPSG